MPLSAGTDTPLLVIPFDGVLSGAICYNIPVPVEQIIRELDLSSHHYWPFLRRSNGADFTRPRIGSGRRGDRPGAAQRNHLLAFFHVESDISGIEQPGQQPSGGSVDSEQFHYAFTNNLSEEESLAVYQRYVVPGPDHVLFQAALANFNSHAPTTVNFDNKDRAPLLLIYGGQDHVSPASVVEANFKLYRKSEALTEYKEFPERTHFTLGQDGWEEVADYTLNWAIEHASTDLRSKLTA